MVIGGKRIRAQSAPVPASSAGYGQKNRARYLGFPQPCCSGKFCTFALKLLEKLGKPAGGVQIVAM